MAVSSRIMRRFPSVVFVLQFGSHQLSVETVCKSWHTVATKDNFNSDLPRVPWLMLAEEKDDITFVFVLQFGSHQLCVEHP
ncbi:hypothetical protein K7X08_013365 [Anisodus acutangulus]|uniref:F-box domain-containing protein n=1 Tax=Anisodus acutangulus TaxID=402998 RepID=A0A9Q1MBE9_9SOLA|nr:hypothetical protein K7X08_013365 [Anisodus acutangulus]